MRIIRLTFVSCFTFMILLAILATIFPFFNNFSSGYSIPIQLLIKAFNSKYIIRGTETVGFKIGVIILVLSILGGGPIKFRKNGKRVF